MNPEGPCTQTVYTWALKYSLYGYIGPKVYTIWVHGPLGEGFTAWFLDFSFGCRFPRLPGGEFCS